MYITLCKYVCARVCVRVCVHVCVAVCVSKSVHVLVHVCIHTIYRFHHIITAHHKTLLYSQSIIPLQSHDQTIAKKYIII